MASEWYFTTNHLNLRYMMSTGLVAAKPFGARGAVYDDSLSFFRGWVPLFGKIIPRGVLEECTRAADFLRPCVLSFNLPEVVADGFMQRVRDTMKFKPDSIKEGMGYGQTLFVLLQAPLPLGLCSGIYFRTDEDKRAFELSAAGISNTDIESYKDKLAVNPALFAADAAAAPWPLYIDKSCLLTQDKVETEEEAHQEELPFGDEQVASPSQTTSPSDDAEQPTAWHMPVQAFGGMLAMLYYGAMRSRIGADIFHWLFGAWRSSSREGFPEARKYYILPSLPDWLVHHGELPESANFPARLFWGVARNIATTYGEGSAVEAALCYLDGSLTGSDEKYRDDFERLVADMRGSYRLGGGSISDRFGRNKGPLSHALLLLCLLDRCPDLLQFSHPKMNPEGYLLACILFGIKDGWKKMPNALRTPALSCYISCCMAAYEQRSAEDWCGKLKNPLPAGLKGEYIKNMRPGRYELQFHMPPCPQPLRAFFPEKGLPWEPHQEAAAIKISRRCQWEDCMETVVAPSADAPHGEPVKEGGALVFPGDVAKTRIKPLRFLQRFGDEWTSISAELESEIKRDLLPRQQQR